MPTKLLAVLRRAVLQIPEGKLGDLARRAEVSRRQISRIRAGTAAINDMRASTISRLARALGLGELTFSGGAHPKRGGTASGRGRGRMRTARRQNDAGDLDRPAVYEEDNLGEE